MPRTVELITAIFLRIMKMCAGMPRTVDLITAIFLRIMKMSIKANSHTLKNIYIVLLHG